MSSDEDTCRGSEVSSFSVFRVSDKDTVVGVRLHVVFSKDRDATANAFWSLTMYDE